MTRDRIAFLADGHLSGDDPERIETLVARLAELGRECATICVLGDLFSVWLGVEECDPAPARVCAALRELRASGVRTIYVEGNRDFAIGRGATAGCFDLVVAREHVERFGALRYHLSHGDLVNPADRPYRAWRAVAKGVLAPALLAVLPARRASALACWLERRLSATNRRHKSYFPEERCRAFAASRVAAGADVVVVGHFHRELDVGVEAGGRTGRFLSLPFWHEEPRAVVFDAGGRRLA